MGEMPQLSDVQDASASPVPRLSVPTTTAPGVRGPSGVAPRQQFTRVNSGVPDVADAGAQAQKSLQPTAPGMKTASEVPMNIAVRPTLQQLMQKAAMDGTASAASQRIEDEARRQVGDLEGIKQASATCAETTAHARKLASAVEYIAKQASDIGPGVGPGALPVSAIAGSGTMNTNFGESRANQHPAPTLQPMQPGEAPTHMKVTATGLKDRLLGLFSKKAEDAVATDAAPTIGNAQKYQRTYSPAAIDSQAMSRAVMTGLDGAALGGMITGRPIGAIVGGAAGGYAGHRYAKSHANALKAQVDQYHAAQAALGRGASVNAVEDNPDVMPSPGRGGLAALSAFASPIAGIPAAVLGAHSGSTAAEAAGLPNVYGHTVGSLSAIRGAGLGSLIGTPVGAALGAGLGRALPGNYTLPGVVVGGALGNVVGGGIGAHRGYRKGMDRLLEQAATPEEMPKAASLVRQRMSKLAEDAINPAHISSGKYAPLATSVAGQSGPAARDKDVVPGTYEGVAALTRRAAKANMRADMNQYVDEPMQTASTDHTLQNAFSHTSEAGAKVASVDPSRVAASRAMIAKLAEAGSR